MADLCSCCGLHFERGDVHHFSHTSEEIYLWNEKSPDGYFTVIDKEAWVGSKSE